MNANSPTFRRAGFSLLIIGLLLHLIDFYWYRLFSSQAYFDSNELRLLREQWRKEDSLQLVLTFPKNSIAINQASQKEIENSGLDALLAQRLVKYRNSFGPLHSTEDLKRIYGIDTLWLEAMEEYLDFTLVPEDNKIEKKALLSLDTFNPNKVSEDELVKMGLPQSVVRGIISFREKYRPFEKPFDIYKVYTIDSALGRVLLPFIEMDSIFEDSIIASIDLNHADTNLLKKLPKFGSISSADFIQYRERLGGFYVKEQLLELYFIDSLWLARNEGQIQLKGPIRSLNINSASVENLSQHPYISYSLARNMVEFRERVGLFNSVSELVNIELVDDVLLRKLAPYLRISDNDSSASLSRKQ